MQKYIKNQYCKNKNHILRNYFLCEQLFQAINLLTNKQRNHSLVSRIKNPEKRSAGFGNPAQRDNEKSLYRFLVNTCLYPSDIDGLKNTSILS